MNKMMCLLPVGNVDMPGYQPTIARPSTGIEQRKQQVTAVIRAVSLVIGLLAVSGVASAQTRLDVLAAFGPAGLQSPQAPLIQGTDGTVESENSTLIDARRKPQLANRSAASNCVSASQWKLTTCPRPARASSSRRIILVARCRRMRPRQ